ncbi:MAG: M50 family metallopeptidase, partial [Candidatus Binatia bacterium]
METFVTYLLAAVVVLGLLIFVHELGHFLLAKLCGVSVLRFSLGFGPRLFGKRVGETEYVVSVVPLGGYVKMLGEDEDEESGASAAADPARSFSNQSLSKRFAIVFAGPFFNFLFSWLCLLFVAAAYGILVPAESARVGGLSAGLPAERAGLQEDDLVVAVDGTAIERWDELSERIVGSGGKAVTLEVMREGQPLEIAVTPEKQINRNLFGEELGEAYR